GAWGGLGGPATPAGDPEAIVEAARALRHARSPVLLVEGLGRMAGGPEALQGLSELLAVPVIELGASFNLSNRHPFNLTAARDELLREADLVVAVGVRDLEAALKRPAPQAGGVGSGLPRGRAGYGPRVASPGPQGPEL